MKAPIVLPALIISILTSFAYINFQSPTKDLLRNTGGPHYPDFLIYIAPVFWGEVIL